MENESTCVIPNPGDIDHPGRSQANSFGGVAEFFERGLRNPPGECKHLVSTKNGSLRLNSSLSTAA
jgi:hypothetical protein